MFDYFLTYTSAFILQTLFGFYTYLVAYLKGFCFSPIHLLPISETITIKWSSWSMWTSILPTRTPACRPPSRRCGSCSQCRTSCPSANPLPRSTRAVGRSPTASRRAPAPTAGGPVHDVPALGPSACPTWTNNLLHLHFQKSIPFYSHKRLF